MQLKDIPNIITIARIILIAPIAMLLINKLFVEALILFFVAGLSDGLDGFLAKRFKWRSDLGAILDPLADKSLLIVVYIFCSIIEIIPWWLTIILVLRDAVIISGATFYYKNIQKITMSPSIVSKINTFMQILLILVLLLNQIFFIFEQLWMQYFFYIVLTTTLLSGADYIWTWGIKALKNNAKI